MSTSIIIGITECVSYSNYENWLVSESGVKTIKLSYRENNFELIRDCDAILLSGGEDVDPSRYSKEEYRKYCDVNAGRDELEFKVLDYVTEKKLPLLGICRGLQVANVYYGGTLFPDLPTFGKYNHSKFPNADRYHAISLDPDSLLCQITGTDLGRVNSSHHQSCDRAGSGLVVNSFSPDGVVEGMEWLDKNNKPYLMLVQWHPERMTDLMSPFSKKLKNSFLEAARQRNNK